MADYYLTPAQLVIIILHFVMSLKVVSESDVKQAIKAVVEKCGPLRAVVNTAGIVRIAETLSHASEAHPLSLFEEIIKVND